MKLKRILRWSGWSLLALFVLGIAVWTIANVVGSSRLKAEIEELQRVGYEVRLDRPMPAIAPEENAAPLYSAAFALYVPQATTNKAYYDPSQFASLPFSEKAPLLQWVAGNSDALDLVSRARSRSRCRFERDYSEPYMTLLPELSKVIALSNCLCVRAQSQMDEGNAAAARDSVRDLFALADSLREDPSLVSQLVRIVSIGIGLETISSCVSKDTSAAELSAWLGILPPPARFDGMMEQAMRGELASAAQTLADGLFWRIECLTGRGLAHGEDVPFWKKALAPLAKLDGARYLTIMRRAVEIVRKPYLDARGEADALMREEVLDAGWLRPVTRTLMPAVGKANASHAHLLAHLAAVRTGLEFELAYHATGKYPAEVKTIDPFTGKPLRYVPEKGRIVSLGPDGVDDELLNTDVWVLRRRP